MKRFKLYLSLILVVCLLGSTVPLVQAAQALEYSMSYIMNPVPGVSGEIYGVTPYGFIIKDYNDYQNITTAFVTDKGVAIPNSDKNFTYVDKNGLIEYWFYDENGNGQSGIMDTNGNIIIPEDKYNAVYTTDDQNRFVCAEKTDSNDMWSENKWGVVDREGNEIIPFGKYSDFYWWGTMRASDESGNINTIVDFNGNVIATYNSETDGYPYPLAASDRYIVVYDEYYGKTSTKTCIKSIDGSDIAVIDSVSLHPNSDTVLEGTEYYDGGMKRYYYDFDGNLLLTEDSKDWLGNNGMPYREVSANEAQTQYFIDDEDYSNQKVVDKSGNVVYSNSEIDILSLYKDKFIKIADKNWDSMGLLDMSGNTLIPLGEYSGISYCEELDIFALEKNNQISIAKITPVTVNVNGKDVLFDQNPVIKDGRTLVPLRAIFESLGATVDWDPSTSTVTSTLGNITVKLMVGSNRLSVNNVEIELDVPALLINGRTLVPARAISEAFGCSVDWNSESRTVIIKSK